MILIFMYSIANAGAPRLVSVTPVNSTTVTVSWSEVQCFNGSGAVTHYLVQYQSMCSGPVQNVKTSSTVETVSGLVPNAAMYTFQVAAVGASQKIGPFSNPANMTLHGEVSIGHKCNDDIMIQDCFDCTQVQHPCVPQVCSLRHS